MLLRREKKKRQRDKENISLKINSPYFFDIQFPHILIPFKFKSNLLLSWHLNSKWRVKLKIINYALFSQETKLLMPQSLY
jgi:hypothetical protein